MSETGKNRIDRGGSLPGGSRSVGSTSARRGRTLGLAIFHRRRQAAITFLTAGYGGCDETLQPRTGAPASQVGI